MIATTAHQSRWGYHPCDYQDFKKIKFLHKHFWLAQKAQARNERYYRKAPHNRVIRKQKGMPIVPIPMPVPFFPKVYEQILKKPIVVLYQRARHPQSSPDTVVPLPISMSQVEEWLTAIEKAYNS